MELMCCLIPDVAEALTRCKRSRSYCILIIVDRDAGYIFGILFSNPIA